MVSGFEIRECFFKLSDKFGEIKVTCRLFNELSDCRASWWAKNLARSRPKWFSLLGVGKIGNSNHSDCRRVGYTMNAAP